MALWTDIIEPATLTGFMRESLIDYEASKGSLETYLPNETVADTEVRFAIGREGLVEEAKFRAWDAEPEMGKGEGFQRVTMEIPAISQKEVVTEYKQLRLRNAGDDSVLDSILKTSRRNVVAIADRIERLRGVVLLTGKATVDQYNFKINDDFGRDPELTTTAGTLFSAADADPVAYLETLIDLYVAKNGFEPGTILGSKRIFRAIQNNAKYATVLAGGDTRPATADQARAVMDGAGLPQYVEYNRRTFSGAVIPDDTLLLLPPSGQEAGNTYWGQTLTSMDPAFGLADSDMPGLVAGVYRNPQPPMIAEVIADAIAMPVLSNPNSVLAAKVL